MSRITAVRLTVHGSAAVPETLVGPRPLADAFDGEAYAPIPHRRGYEGPLSAYVYERASLPEGGGLEPNPRAYATLAALGFDVRHVATLHGDVMVCGPLGKSLHGLLLQKVLGAAAAAPPVLNK